MKKVFIGFAVVALLLGVSAIPVKADQISDLYAAIAALNAQIATLGGTTPTGGGYLFTKDLTVGSKGADVTALQEILISSGDLTIAAPTGYYGAMTKAAVMKWQKANDITPASGLVYSKTRAALNAMSATVPPLDLGGTPSGPCTGGAMFNSVTGASCTTVLPAGCTSTSGFSPLTGMSCAGTVIPPTYPAGCTSATGYSVTTGISCAGGTVITPGGATEGSITTRLAASPADNTNVRQTTDVSVYGVEVEAVNSDMSVDRVDLEFTATTWGSTSTYATASTINPGNFINTIKAWDGTTMLGSWAVNSTSFSKDSSDKYHIILSGLGSKVTKGTKKNITFSISVNGVGSTDVPRRIAVQGYSGNTQNIRATDSVGLQSYANMSGSANTRTHDFKAAGASTLTVTINSAMTPLAGNSRVSSTNGITKKIMQAFDAKSESGSSKITKIYVGTNATSSSGVPNTYYLCDGSDTSCVSPLASVTAGTTDNLEVAFTSLSINVPQDTSKTFLIAADFPTTVGGQQASSSLHANAVQWEKPDGSTASSTPSSEIAGNDHYFASAVPQWTLTGAPKAVTSNPTVAGQGTTTVAATLSFTVKADGGALTAPVVEDFGLCFASSTQTTYTSGAVNCIGPGDASFSSRVIDSIVPTPDATVGDGGMYTVTVRATLIKSGTCAVTGVCASGQSFQLVATSTRATVGGNNIRQTWNVGSWHTPFSDAIN